MTITPIISALSAVIEDPALWTSHLPAALAGAAPRLVEKGGAFAWLVDGRTAAPSARLRQALDALPTGQGGAALDNIGWLSTAEGRTWLQERDDVQGEVLYSVGGVWDLINASGDPAFVLACYRAYNDWIADLSSQDPGSFVGLARIPVTGVVDATAELIRAVETLKLRGAILDAWPDGFEGPPAGPDADPFWEAAAALNAPVSIHQALNGAAEAPAPIHHGAAPSYAFDLNAIVYGNVFDRYPDLKIVSANPTVGWAPTLFEGLSESYMRTSGVRRIQLAKDLLPNDYLRTFIWYVIQDDRFGVLNRDYFGDAHVMWGSFALSAEDSVWPNTRRLFESHLAGMAPATRTALASDVVSRLYGLGGAKPFTAEDAGRYARYALIQ